MSLENCLWVCHPAVHIRTIDGSYTNMCDQLIALKKEEKDLISEHLKALPYKDFLRTFYWRTVRHEVLRKRRYRCDVCRNHANQAHHMRYDNHGREHLHLDDLRALCESCHRILHELPVDAEDMLSGDPELCRMLAGAACMARGIV